MAVITQSDLISYLREPDAEVSMIVELADGIVSEVVGTVPFPVPTRMRAIALEVAARAYRNPNGYSSETIDDYTYRRDNSTQQAGVYLTDAERMELLALDGFLSAGAYS